MEGRIVNGKAFLRVDKNEDVIEQVTKFLTENDITAASITGIGATDHVIVGLFDTNTKEYIKQEYQGMYEVSNFTGNATTKDGQTYLHMHITFCDKESRTYGGHLNFCNISGACELFFDIFDGIVEREMDEDIGLNLLRFD